MDAYAHEPPDCCWKCGKIGHHWQESTNVTPLDEKKVSRLCKRIHKEAVGAKMEQRLYHSIQQLKNFPVLGIFPL